MSFILVSREIIEVDVEKAKKYLEYNSFKSQRKLNKDHVNDLAKKMKNNLFTTAEIALATKNTQDDVVLANGQHVCSAIVLSGKPQYCTVSVYKVFTELGLSELFRQFDGHKKRNIQDMVRVEKDSLSLSWNNKLATILVTAASIEKLSLPNFESYSKNFSPDDKTKLLRDYLEEGNFIKRIVYDESDSIPRHLQKGPIYYVMFNTWRIAPKDAHSFWTRVRDGENLTKKMPEFILREFLLKASSFSSRKEKQYRRATNHEIVFKCRVAWNNFREGKQTAIKYFPDKNPPELV
jgi:hypothetical protein